MPRMNGFDALKQLKGDSGLMRIPVIIISAVDDLGQIARGLEAGADDYLVKPFNAVLLKARIKNALQRKWYLDQEERLRVAIENQNAELEKRVRQQVQQISSTQMATIFALSKLAESRDPETGAHLERMQEYCRILAEHLATQESFRNEITGSFIQDLHAASPLHDIGKVGIPDHILRKPGPLTAEEFEVMKTHAAIGAVTLQAVNAQHPGNAFVAMGVEIALSHHERWNGRGYPNGLTGTKIPLVGRIVALGDVYDALTSKRCYKDPMPHEQARDIILSESGKHFDPAIVQAFMELEPQFMSIRKKFQDPEDADQVSSAKP